MKKLLWIFILTFLLGAAPAFAKEQAQPQTTCDPNANWKNHGEYVSCVARLHKGGKAVSEAAKSDIGEKEDSNKAQESPEPSESPASSSSPSASPSASPAAVSQAVNMELQALIQTLQNILTSLQKLAQI